MAVNRCICFDRTFEELLQIAVSTGGGLLEAHKQTGCGARCGLCLPYIQLMLREGSTDLPVLWSEDFRREGINPGRIAKLEARIRDELESSSA
ncbi:MAG: hypothetical protein AAGI53_02125 [Planctomycetota bacterium]